MKKIICIFSFLFFALSTFSQVQKIAAGKQHSLFICSGGTVRAAGNNTHGQLGIGNNSDTSIAVQVPGLSNIVSVAAGGRHSLFLRNDGIVFAAGYNYHGQLGDSTNNDSNTPVQVSISDVVAIAAGYDFSLFLKNDGTVWACGDNYNGQLGDSTNTDSNVPVQVSISGIVTALSAGNNHSLYLKNDSTAWSCGKNATGMLGDSSFVDRNVPVKVKVLSGVVAIAAGQDHSVFLKGDGTVWSCGNNGVGQLGIGPSGDKETPVLIGISGVVKIAAGVYHSLYLKNDGTVWGNGYNYANECATGSWTQLDYPAYGSLLSQSVSAIAAGEAYSLFLLSNGTVRAAGENYYGQLADGTTTGSNYDPVQPQCLCSPSGTPSVSVPADMTVCQGTDVTVTASGSGGTAPYGYYWEGYGWDYPYDSTQVANIYFSGSNSYTCTVTDFYGCKGKDSMQITSITAPTNPYINSNPTNICSGENVTLTASGGTGDYTWFPGGSTATTIIVNPTVTTTYTLVTTDNVTGCMSQSNSTIYTLAANPYAYNESCPGVCDGYAMAYTSGGTPPYTYQWSNNGSDSGIYGLCVGSYTLTVTDNNSCVHSDSIQIISPASINLSVSKTDVTCFSACNGTAVANPTGGTTPYYYNWQPGSFTTQSVSGLCPGDYTVTVTDAGGCTASATATVTITEPSVLAANISSSGNVSCNGGNNGYASLAVNGGTSPYSYSWSNSASTSTVSGLAAGTYSVIITDSQGCLDTVTHSVTQPTAIIVNVSPMNVTCNGGTNGSASAGVTGGVSPYIFSWNPSAQVTQTATGLTAGNYTVNVTDNNGCVSTKTVAVTEPDAILPNASVTSNVSCNTFCNGGVTSSPSGGTGSFTYSWMPGGYISPSVSSLCAATYSLTVTDGNGCTASSTVTVTEPTVFSVSTSQTDVNCNGGNDGTATAVPSGGTSPYTYLWSTGGISATEINLQALNYTVTVTDNNGCTASATVTINEPATGLMLSGGSSPVSCFGGNNGGATVVANGAMPPYTYNWSNGGTTSAISNVIAGTYTVTVYDNNGCSAWTLATVNEPTALTTSITSSSNTSCALSSDGSATVSASGGTSPYLYQWNDAQLQVTPTATGLVAASYTVTVTDNNSCTSTASVSISQPSALSVTITSGNVSCNGGNNGNAAANVAGGTSPYTYSWMPIGGNSSSANNLPAGNYTVNVTDANGCAASGTVAITQPAVLTVSASVNNAACYGTNTGSAMANVSGGTAPYNYFWNTGQVSQTVSNLPSGDYYVHVIDANGCSASDSAFVNQPLQIPLTVSVTNTSCGNATGSAAASVNGPGAIPPFTYLWTTGSTTTAANNLSAGLYRINVTDGNGCFSFADALVANSNGPTVTLNSVNDVSCSGLSDGSAAINVSGGNPPYNFLWSNGQVTQNSTGLAYGPHEIKVSDASGCIAQLSVFVNEPLKLTLASSAVNSACGAINGSASVIVSGGTGPYSYQWNGGQTTSSVTGIGAGIYDVVVTDSKGCSDSILVAVQDSGGPVVFVDTIAAANCGSNGYILLLPQDSLSIASFAWNTGSTDQNLSNASPGNYGVVITDTSGCKSVLLAPVNPVLPPVKPICLVTVDSTSSFNIVMWDKPQSLFVAGFSIYRESSMNGVYQKIAYVPYSNLSQYFDSIVNPDDRWAKYRISMRDICGAEGPLSPEHKTIHLAVQSVSPSSYDLIWDDYKGYPFTQYYIYRKYNFNGTWALIDSVPSNVTTYSDMTFSATDTCYYHIDVAHPNGCTASVMNSGPEANNLNSSKSNLQKVMDSTLTATLAATDGLVISVFPNPGSGVFTVELKGGHAAGEITVHNMLGVQVKRQRLSGSRFTVDLTALPDGIYQLQFQETKRAGMVKLVKGSGKMQ